MNMHTHGEMDKVLRPDAKGRIFLGKLAEGVSSYHVHIDDRNRIILEPYMEIPIDENWLFQNPQAIKSVTRGLQEAEAGQISPYGSFLSHIDED